MKKLIQPNIKEVGNAVHLDCVVCEMHKVVNTKDTKSAYIQINRFRIVHEHYIKGE